MTFDPVEWLLQEDQRKKTPQEVHFKDRYNFLQALNEGLSTLFYDISSQRPEEFKMPNGKRWPGEDKMGVTPPTDVMGRVLHPHIRVVGIEPKDPVSVFFTEEYKRDRNGIISRWYNEIGYVRHNGQRVVYMKGPWGSSRDAFAEMRKMLGKLQGMVKQEQEAAYAQLEDIRGKVAYQQTLRFASSLPKGSALRKALLRLL